MKHTLTRTTGSLWHCATCGRMFTAEMTAGEIEATPCDPNYGLWMAAAGLLPDLLPTKATVHLTSDDPECERIPIHDRTMADVKGRRLVHVWMIERGTK